MFVFFSIHILFKPIFPFIFFHYKDPHQKSDAWKFLIFSELHSKLVSLEYSKNLGGGSIEFFPLRKNEDADLKLFKPKYFYKSDLPRHKTYIRVLLIIAQNTISMFPFVLILYIVMFFYLLSKYVLVYNII